jgi:hypothetical protein
VTWPMKTSDGPECLGPVSDEEYTGGSGGAERSGPSQEQLGPCRGSLRRRRSPRSMIYPPTYHNVRRGLTLRVAPYARPGAWWSSFLLVESSAEAGRGRATSGPFSMPPASCQDAGGPQAGRAPGIIGQRQCRHGLESFLCLTAELCNGVRLLPLVRLKWRCGNCRSDLTDFVMQFNGRSCAAAETAGNRVESSPDAQWRHARKFSYPPSGALPSWMPPDP